MTDILAHALEDAPANTRGKAAAIGAALVASNVLAWMWAIAAFHDRPVLLGTALLAYSFGLRHAVDADHIAAIDNVIRKLMQSGSKPISAGLFFALGHSTIVVAASVIIALAMTRFESQLESFKEIGGVIGTSVSALFLLAIAVANTIILVSVVRVFRAVRRGETLAEGQLHGLQLQRGFVGRLVRPIFGMISKSWHMYPLGILFGLGFDTATEVGLLGISAAQGTQGLSIWSILCFPALFAAGMSLVDTADGMLMVGAYGWAFRTPIRKLYYNMTITSISVVVAFAIGGIELLGLLEDKFDFEGRGWSYVATLNDSVGALGYLTVGVFVACWAGARLLYRFNRYDEVDAPIRPRP